MSIVWVNGLSTPQSLSMVSRLRYIFLCEHQTFINCLLFSCCMIVPVRCMSCGKPIGQFWDVLQDGRKAGKATKEILDECGVTRYCCRAQLLGHVDLIDVAAKFKRA